SWLPDNSLGWKVACGWPARCPIEQRDLGGAIRPQSAELIVGRLGNRPASIRYRGQQIERIVPESCCNAVGILNCHEPPIGINGIVRDARAGIGCRAELMTAVIGEVEPLGDRIDDAVQAWSHGRVPDQSRAIPESVHRLQQVSRVVELLITAIKKG